VRMRATSTVYARDSADCTCCSSPRAPSYRTRGPGYVERFRRSATTYASPRSPSRPSTGRSRPRGGGHGPRPRTDVAPTRDARRSDDSPQPGAAPCTGRIRAIRVVRLRLRAHASNPRRGSHGGRGSINAQATTGIAVGRSPGTLRRPKRNCDGPSMGPWVRGGALQRSARAHNSKFPNGPPVLLICSSLEWEW
jgi:hypothetical protein